MKINLSLKGYILKDVVGYGTELDGLAVNAGIPTLLTAKPYLTFKSSLAGMNEGFKLSFKSDFTELLAELDWKRGRSYTSLHHGVLSFAYSDIPAEEEAAQTLIKLFDTYGFEFINGTYEGETGLEMSFIADLKKPENAAAVATLKLEAKVAQLEKDVNTFSTTYKESLADAAEKKNFVAASNVRNEFEKATKNFQVYLQGKLLEDTDPKWEALCAQVVALNVRMLRSEALRQVALKNKREDEKNQGAK